MNLADTGMGCHHLDREMWVCFIGCEFFGVTHDVFSKPARAPFADETPNALIPFRTIHVALFRHSRAFLRRSGFSCVGRFHRLDRKVSAADFCKWGHYCLIYNLS